MNKKELQKLSELRVKEAELLLENNEFSGAYYISGYAIECALKACIAGKTKKYEFPDKNFVNKIYTHNLTELMNSSGLKMLLDKEMEKNNSLAANWSTVKDWSEKSRYEFKTEIQAKDLYQSIVSKKNGILRWIKKHW